MQYSRPDGTTLSNNWSAIGASTMHEATDDDGSTDDSDYCNCGTDAEVLELTMSSVTDPVSAVDHTMRIWTKSSGSGSPEKFNWKLYEGTGGGRTEICGENNVNAGRSSNFSESVAYALSESEANAISDYTDLHIEIVLNIGAGESFDVGSFRLDVPDPVSARRIFNVT
jgi:hypothetical protein